MEQTTVVVGVEGAAGSRAAIRQAAREARYRQAPLVAVMTYSSNPTLGAPAARPLSSLHTVLGQTGRNLVVPEAGFPDVHAE